MNPCAEMLARGSDNLFTSSVLGYIFALACIRTFYINIDAMEKMQVEISAMERASKRRRFPLLRPQQISECWVKIFVCKPAYWFLCAMITTIAHAVFTS